jgi:hypothetical protein
MQAAATTTQFVQSVQSGETASSSQAGNRTSNVGSKSLLDAGPRNSGVSSDTAYAAQHGQQGTPSRFYQGTEGSWMSLQSLQSSLADEPMSTSHVKPHQRLSQDAVPLATGSEQRDGRLLCLRIEYTLSTDPLSMFLPLP